MEDFNPKTFEEVFAYLELCKEEAKDKGWGNGIGFAMDIINDHLDCILENIKNKSNKIEVMIIKDEQLDEFYKDRCDYRNGDNEKEHYDSCTECYRYDTCKSAHENHVLERR